MKRFALSLCALLTALLASCAAQPKDVAIIGGADGPTAIFVADSSGGLSWPVLAGIALVVTVVVRVIQHRGGKK